MARFVTLYSGSSGNSCVVEDDGSFLLVDVGKSCSITLGALVKVGLTPKNLAGILITHEHIDHVRGLKVLLKQVPVPVYGSEETLAVLARESMVPPLADLVAISNDPVWIEGFSVQAFSLSHDAAGCSGYRITTSSEKIAAVATDLGMMTQQNFSCLEGAHLVALESNYDREMLRLGRYPAYLKRRIESDRGHLSNNDSAAAVAELLAKGCKKVALCHLSEENNELLRVRETLEQTLSECGVQPPAGCEVQIARRHEPGDWMHF